ncbi:MAG: GNAT family N-acetyltransferase [Chloroflexota bacterium]|jgi:predicted GNAT family acetyltransferase
MDDYRVHNNTTAGQFEVRLEGHTALIAYLLEPGQITFDHTEVPPALEGRGIGSALAKAALEYARQNGLAVVPLCPFVRGYLKRHPQYHKMLAKGVDL